MPYQKLGTMDSLVTSAIALAAGGWDKVKLAGIYTHIASLIPSWKLGIYSPHAPATLGGTMSGLAWCSAVLISSNSRVDYVNAGMSFSVQFNTQSITSSTSSDICGTAVLFNWD